MTLLEREEESRDEQRQGEGLVRSDRHDRRQLLPLGVRTGLVLFGLCFGAVAIFVPTSLVSEAVWVLLFAGCVLWEAVGVFKEKRWSQEPLTRLYRDRLMKLPGWGKLFRIGFLFLFVWWLAHWLLPGF